MAAFDVIVLGAGPGGYVCAIRAAQLGLSAAIVEPDELGGLCLNWGCIPSKALLRNADVLNTINNAADFGITVGSVDASLDQAITRSRRVVHRLVRGVTSLLRSNNVTVVNGRGTLLDSHRLLVDTEPEPLEANEAIVIATGAQERAIPGLDVNGETVVTSREALERRDLPERVLIIGGGATGCEFAYFYRSYGSAVTLVELMPNLLPGEDTEITAALKDSLTRQGIEVLTESRVNRLTSGGAELDVAGASRIIPFDMALVAVGMQGRTEGLGLDAAGVATGPGGYIECDDTMQTNIPGVYAIGDVTGPPLLAHAAMAQGVLAAEAIAGRETQPLIKEDIPRAVYCHPQVASMGITEAQAAERGITVNVGRFPYRANGKALSLDDYAGMIKVVSDAETGALLGAQMVGPECAELLGELSVAKLLEATPLEIGRAIHPHPTLSETLMEASLAAFGEAIHM
ncbi:MAG: dihydrolipoyl dehydrogenase [Chloroflexi bacterium]|nr:dihydrolipoyl dehydrogenase [Chloroflexota bacterium]